MLEIVIEGEEYYNEETETFETLNDVVLQLEHSLLSLSKWESKYQKPFLSAGEKTTEEIFGYLKAMVITPGVGRGGVYENYKKKILFRSISTRVNRLQLLELCQNVEVLLRLLLQNLYIIGWCCSTFLLK
jgi:hypothetical protein